MANVGKWFTEGSDITDFQKYNDLIYKNGIIEIFLTDPQKYFIIAGKGIGKTVLLKYKRYLMESKASGISFLPSGNTYLDFVDNITKTLSAHKNKQHANLEFCENFWRLAIQLCILSNSSISNTSISQLKDDAHLKTSSSVNFNNDFDFLLKNKRGIEVIFDHLMSMGFNKLQELFNISSLIADLFRQSINKPIYYFFDRFDQALKHTDESIWYSMQQGLLEAAWNIMKGNSHIKIYLSLRQEAYDAYHSINKESMTANTSIISYTDKELYELITKLVEFYEGEKTLEKFLKINKFTNTVTHNDEQVYKFMNRYSIGRPRDFVVFCDKLSERVNDKFDTDEERAKQLKEIIITAASSNIIDSLHNEVHMLLKCLKERQDFDKFVKLFSRNVLTYNELQKYCFEYNDSNCSKNCSSCKDESGKRHPFCDLYVMGLLGKIEKTGETNEFRQVFRSPYKDFTSARIYGDSNYYLIHPSLRYYIKSRKDKLGEAYELYDCLLIGDSLPWTDKDTIITEANKIIDKIKKKNVKEYLVQQLIDFAKSKTPKPYSQLISEYQNTDIQVTQSEGNIIGDVIKLLSIDKDKKISVFVSYAYENEEHKDHVIGFTKRLRKMGFNATMDEFMKIDYPNIDEMMTEGLKCDKVIVVLSKDYKEKAENQKRSGVWKEFKMISNDLDKNEKKYIFVSFDSYSTAPPEKISPMQIGNRWIVYIEKNKKNRFNELISYITDINIYPIVKVNDKTKKVKKKNIKDF